MACRLWVICVREDNDSNVYAMITWPIWTTWTSLSAVPRKAVKFNHSLTHSLTPDTMLMGIYDIQHHEATLNQFTRHGWLIFWGLGDFISGFMTIKMSSKLSTINFWSLKICLFLFSSFIEFFLVYKVMSWSCFCGTHLKYLSGTHVW